MTFTSDQTVTGLQAAINAVGGRKIHLADKLGLTGAAITRWGDEIPLKWVLDAERVTGVPRYILRPDMFAGAPPPKKKRAA